MPGLGFAFRQVHPGQSLGKIAAYTNLLAVWHETGEWFAVFEQHERNVLVVGPINALRKIARGLSHGDAGLLHGIRLSDYMIPTLAMSSKLDELAELEEARCRPVPGFLCRLRGIFVR